MSRKTAAFSQPAAEAARAPGLGRHASLPSIGDAQRGADRATLPHSDHAEPMSRDGEGHGRNPDSEDRSARARETSGGGTGPAERSGPHAGAEEVEVLAATPLVIADNADAEEVFVETPLTRWVTYNTLAVRKRWPFVVWSGPPDAGKSATARFLVRDLKRRAAAGEDVGLGEYFVTPEVDGQTADKKMMREIHNRCIKQVSVTRYREASAGDLAEDIIVGCEARDIRTILIDEAGLASLKALRSLCLLRDSAEKRRWPLTIVLIGMDELPGNVRAMPHVKRRVLSWCYFKPYDRKDTRDLLAALYPHFATGDDECSELSEEVTFIHETVAATPMDGQTISAGALPGRVVAFMDKVLAWSELYNQAITLEPLRAVHLLSGRDEELAWQDYQRGYVGLREVPHSSGSTPVPGPSTPQKQAGSQGAPTGSPRKTGKPRTKRPKGSHVTPGRGQ